MLPDEVVTHLFHQVALCIQRHQWQAQTVSQAPPARTSGFALQPVGLSQRGVMSVQLKPSAELRKA